MDREWFREIGFELAPTSKMKLMDETFMAYRAFTAPREKLYVSYPVADEEGKALIPSLYIARIQQLLTGTQTIYAVTDPSELAMEANQFDYISHPRAALAVCVDEIERSEQHRVCLAPDGKRLWLITKRIRIGLLCSADITTPDERDEIKQIDFVLN